MYEDIIEYDYQGVREHSRMSMQARAAQFAPFAALNGYEDAIDETTKNHG